MSDPSQIPARTKRSVKILINLERAFTFEYDPMPKATTEKFRRAHQPAPKKKEESHTSASNTNPLFNTARFGQHILKNPATAQKSVLLFFSDEEYFSLNIYIYIGGV